MENVRNMGRVAWRGVAISLFVPAAIAIGCSSSSNGASPGGSDAAVTDATSDAGADGSIGTIRELNADAEVTNAAMCGSMMCVPPSGGMFPLTACCLPGGGCGASFGSMGGDAGPACISTAAGTPDPSCPASASAMGMPSCCSATGVCGVDLSMLGLGCNPLSVFGAAAGGGTSPPQRCGDAAAGPVPDAGSGSVPDADAGSVPDAAGSVPDANADSISDAAEAGG
jgi:hypothetical protein